MKKTLSVVLIVLSLLLGACAPAATPTVETPPDEPVTLRLTLLPILETLPAYVADEMGLFAKYNIKIETIPAASAAERDQILAAGQADGVVNDLLAVVLYNREQTNLQVLRFAHQATAATPLYRIVAAPNSSIKTVQDLKGVEIGVSQASIIQYVTDRLLKAEGLTNDEIKYVIVPKIPDRLALISSGELKAATLPEPFGTIAILNGAFEVTNDTRHTEYGNSVLSLKKDFIEANPQAVEGFLAAWQEAVDLINAEPGKWSETLKAHNLIPVNMLEGFSVPALPGYAVPTEAQFQDVVQFALDNKLIEKPVSYRDSVRVK
jgi:NitT/TauT family transport system substrate-binding protein